MKTRKFYRIEDERGYGMYRSGVAPGCVQDMQPFCMDTEQDRHPTPRNDERLWDQVKDRGLSDNCFFCQLNSKAEKYFFGFSSKKQLRAWIYKRKWRVELAKSELLLVIYEVTDFIIGDTQAMFVRANTTKTIIPWETVI